MQPLQVSAWVLLATALAVVLTTLGVSLAANGGSSKGPPPEVAAALAAAPGVQRARAQKGEMAQARARDLAASLVNTGNPTLATAVPYVQYPARSDPIVVLQPRTAQEFLGAVDALRQAGFPQVAGKAARPAFATREGDGGEVWVLQPPPLDSRPLKKSEIAPAGRQALAALEHLFGAVFFPVKTTRKCVQTEGGPPCAAPVLKAPVALAVAQVQCPP